MLNVHQSPKYTYLRGCPGGWMQWRLPRCWICRLVHYGSRDESPTTYTTLGAAIKLPWIAISTFSSSTLMSCYSCYRLNWLFVSLDCSWMHISRAAVDMGIPTGMEWVWALYQSIWVYKDLGGGWIDEINWNALNMSKCNNYFNGYFVSSSLF